MNAKTLVYISLVLGSLGALGFLGSKLNKLKKQSLLSGISKCLIGLGIFALALAVLMLTDEKYTYKPPTGSCCCARSGSDGAICIGAEGSESLDSNCSKEGESSCYTSGVLQNPLKCVASVPGPEGRQIPEKGKDHFYFIDEARCQYDKQQYEKDKKNGNPTDPTNMKTKGFCVNGTPSW